MTTANSKLDRMSTNQVNFTTSNPYNLSTLIAKERENFHENHAAGMNDDKISTLLTEAVVLQ